MNKRLYLSNSLTPKELEILLAIAEKGIFNKDDLSRLFNISKSTIRTHLQSLYEKFQVSSLAELIYRYHREKQIQSDKNNN